MPCVVTGLGDEKPKKKNTGMAGLMQRKMDDGFRLYIWIHGKTVRAAPMQSQQTLLIHLSNRRKMANRCTGRCKRIYILLSGGLIRRPALLLKNEEGIYDHIAIYKNKKKAPEPMVTMKNLREYVRDIVDGYVIG